MPNLFTYFKSPPPFEVWHSHPSQVSQVIITAGMHGDERTSIDAAHSLIKTYQGAVPITVIPILNLAGYQKGTSHNPLDNRDPIYYYPGSKLGSSTKQLMSRLAKHVKNNTLWVDLHGGATNEHLTPFIWATQAYPVLSYIKGRVLVENSFERGLPYILLESGELGLSNKTSINQHLQWVSDILSNLNKPAKPNWQPTYNQIIYESRSTQNLTDPNFLWCSPSLYVSGKIA